MALNSGNKESIQVAQGTPGDSLVNPGLGTAETSRPASDGRADGGGSISTSSKDCAVCGRSRASHDYSGLKHHYCDKPYKSDAPATTQTATQTATQAAAHDFMRRIMVPLGLTQTVYPDRDKELARVEQIVLEAFEWQRLRDAAICETSRKQWESMEQTDTIAARAGEARMNAHWIRKDEFPVSATAPAVTQGDCQRSRCRTAEEHLTLALAIGERYQTALGKLRELSDPSSQEREIIDIALAATVTRPDRNKDG